MTQNLLSVCRISIDRGLFEFTHDSLCEMSTEDDGESMALWAGRLNGPQHFRVEAVKIPDQTSMHTESGLAVVVGRDALHELNVWLFRNGLRLVAQIHTHPDSAFHSELDDTIPIVATRGGLSLVIPYFARGLADLDSYAAYRLTDADVWDSLTSAELRALVDVLPPARVR